MPPFVLRPTHAWIAPVALALSAALPLPTAAQAQQRPQSNMEPIKNEQLFRLTQVAAVTVCNLTNAKVSFDTALAATSSAVTTFILEVHGGKVEGVPATLPPQQVFQGATTDIAVQAYKFCKDNIPSENAKRIDDIIKNRQGAGPQ